MKRADLEQLRETWRERISQFRCSGLLGAAWCAANGIKEHQLWYWIRRFPVSPSSNQPRFVPVSVEPLPLAASGFPIPIRIGAATIEVQPGCDLQFLSQLVSVLASTC
ncbi:IS66 family insertion sequence element accessory protein TnpA [Alicyclobacillus suci]|uniref:IS66 family insertion sequence element accessory protein TnpA n=1 Tax=Alicyclobacillus suci TaxID=2816080 RepID=UPI001F289160|nr:helix-turn-helix domain-containing protein [Alicyclobacillus suci]